MIIRVAFWQKGKRMNSEDPSRRSGGLFFFVGRASGQEIGRGEGDTVCKGPSRMCVDSVHGACPSMQTDSHVLCDAQWFNQPARICLAPIVWPSPSERRLSYLWDCAPWDPTFKMLCFLVSSGQAWD